MIKFGKWLGGGLGWAVGGLLGFVIGSAFDGLSGAIVQKGITGGGDFSVSLLILSAAVMKADGKFLKSELEYIKTFFFHQFGKETTEQRMLLFKEILSPHGPQISS
jgi:DnaJ like chaperone protein